MNKRKEINNRKINLIKTTGLNFITELTETLVNYYIHVGLFCLIVREIINM